MLRIQFEIKGMGVGLGSFLKESYDFSASLVLKGFCGTTT